MNRVLTWVFFIGVLALVTYGTIQVIQQQNPPPPAQNEIVESETGEFTSTTYGFSVRYDTALIASTTFARTYLLAENWSLDAPMAQRTGDPVVAFIYPGSNEVLAAELRVGVSEEPSEVEKCMVPPPYAWDVTQGSIGGVPAVVYTRSDAALSHFLQANVYRVLHEDRCISLELIVTGTNPEVYDPPRSVPFAREAARQELSGVVRSFAFVR